MRVTVVILALLLCYSASMRALEIAYYTSLRNDSADTIEVTPDAANGRSHYAIQPGQTVIFLGGFSTVQFVVRTQKHAFAYKFPFTFGALPTHYKGRQQHSYVFSRGQAIYPVDPHGAIVRDAPGFPLTPRSP